ncbi:hypothetical protein [Methylocystis heyeri]|uniref:Spore coat protein U domain-containing protein n=1 Tax=Methylocystis heyeri TaxID=391905 RepID=A0A6B8KDB4_9HYPH|nr:hypothetical protein [Methylocystis heyeri]QGM45677.1 hypothetical protein H2LOC_008170 [Methylocystis heyeri]
MKFKLRIMALALSCGALAASAAMAGTANGVVVLTITGTFNQAVSANGVAMCTGLLYQSASPLAGGVSPNLASIGSVVNLLIHSGSQQASAPATITNNGAGFTCTVTVPYNWANAGPQMGIAYTVKASDKNGAKPGKTQQNLGTIPMPANGVTTPIAVNVSL